MNDATNKARGDIEAYKEQVRNEEVENAKARIDSRLAKNDEQLSKEARLIELKDIEEVLANQYMEHLQRTGGTKINDRDRAWIANQQKVVAKEIASLQPKQEAQKLPSGVNDVWIKGKTGGRMQDKD